MNYCAFCGECYTDGPRRCPDCDHYIGGRALCDVEPRTALFAWALSCAAVAVLAFLGTWLFFSTAGALRWP